VFPTSDWWVRLSLPYLNALHMPKDSGHHKHFKAHRIPPLPNSYARQANSGAVTNYVVQNLYQLPVPSLLFIGSVANHIPVPNRVQGSAVLQKCCSSGNFTDQVVGPISVLICI
jgi:hypothetical protein